MPRNADNSRFPQNLLLQGLNLIKNKLEINKLKVLENEYSSQKSKSSINGKLVNERNAFGLAKSAKKRSDQKF